MHWVLGAPVCILDAMRFTYGTSLTSYLGAEARGVILDTNEAWAVSVCGTLELFYAYFYFTQTKFKRPLVQTVLK